jgi:hypothetical protein
MSWLLEFETLSSVKPSKLQIEQVGIIFQDKRIPQSISFGIAINDLNKEAVIQRSHSICPIKDHFIDKFSSPKSLRYLSSPNLSAHISGAKYERGRRLELAQNLRDSRIKAEKNQFHLNLLSARGDCRSEADALFIGVEFEMARNRANGKYLAINSKKEIKNWESSCELQLFNMNLNDYEKRTEEYLKFKNFDSMSKFAFEKRSISPNFSRLTARDEFERFPFQKIEEQAKFKRYNLGLPVNSSISNSSSDDYPLIPRIPLSSTSDLDDLINF